MADAKATAAMRDRRGDAELQAELNALADKVERIRKVERVRQDLGREKSRDLTVHEAASFVIALAFAGATPGVDAAQWFGQLDLRANGVPVLSVSRGEGRFGAMAVVVDGKRLDGGVGHEGELSSKQFGLRATLRQGQSHVGKEHRGQVLSVDAPGFKFSIESMPAKKYTDPADQIKYAHLNLKFDEGDFPSFSDGFLAQLAGVRQLDRRTEVQYTVGKPHPAARAAGWSPSR